MNKKDWITTNKSLPVDIRRFWWKNKMCEYCNKRADNKKQINIDNECEEFYRVFLPPKQQPLLYVELNAEDEDGYKAGNFFIINYCPMCRQKVR